MRTTIRLDDDLLRENKAHALATDRTLTQVIEDALRETLARRRSAAERPPSGSAPSRAQACSPGSTWTATPPCSV
jgi:hypothetical protein